MSELTRNIASRLRHFIGNRRYAERCQVKLQVRVSLLPNPRTRSFRSPQSIEAHTLDISTSGLGIIVPVIRVDGHYLAGENRTLYLTVALPEGQIEMQATPVRYERLDEEVSEHGYLIGVNITTISDEDREQYEEYVTSLLQH